MTVVSVADREPPPLIGLAALARLAFRGGDLAPIAAALDARRRADPRDAAALMDLALIELFHGRAANRTRLQEEALSRQTFYPRPATRLAPRPIRVLGLAAPGDLMANTPIEFLLEDSDLALDMLYVTPGRPLPDPLPDHDLAFVLLAEADANRPSLDRLAACAARWPRPVLNRPGFIARLTRDGVCALLAGAPGVRIPVTARIDRRDLARLAAGEAAPARIARDCPFPVILRPVGSHAGEALEKIADPGAVGAYLAARPQAEFFLASFVDYRSADGLFRKYRIAVVDSRAYAVHLAISSHWMIHYLNADMIDNPRNRAEEAEFMAHFDRGFGARHAVALAEITRRVGLDYFQIDCGETPDGRLLIFEIGNAMIVHAMDPETLFPYKATQMKRLFGAFQAMLRRAAAAAR